MNVKKILILTTLLLSTCAYGQVCCSLGAERPQTDKIVDTRVHHPEFDAVCGNGINGNAYSGYNFHGKDFDKCVDLCLKTERQTGASPSVCAGVIEARNYYNGLKVEQYSRTLKKDFKQCGNSTQPYCQALNKAAVDPTYGKKCLMNAPQHRDQQEFCMDFIVGLMKERDTAH